MNDDGIGRRRLLEIEQEAADWILRQDRGLTPAEQDELIEWQSADPRHGAQLARQRAVWKRLDALAAWQPEHSAEPNPDLLAPPIRSKLRRFAPALFTGLAAAVAVGFTLGVLLNPDPSLEGPMLVAAVPNGGPRVLEDGTVVELNEGALVTAHFTTTERNVHVEQGEAHFAVTKDPTRPFIVTARGVEMRAVGTAFNVRIDPESAVVEVLVTEGQVQVQRRLTPPASERPGYEGIPEPQVLPVLAARQRAIVSFTDGMEPPQIATLSLSEVERVLSWHHRLLNFTDAPLSEVVRSFNHRNVVQLVLIDAELAASRITLLSFRSDNVEGFVRLLEQGFEARVERRGETEILLHKARPSN